jgi:uncharacterized protein YegP (UPF0339 family)
MSEHLEFYKDEDGKHRWRYVAKNKKILADSGEGYSKITVAKKYAQRVTGRFPVFVIDGKVPVLAEDEILAVKTDD